MRTTAAIPRVQVFLAWTALQILRWIRENTYCGSCGNLLRPSPSERARICPSCGRTIYPRLNPAVIAAVTWKDRLLLTRYAGRAISYYALIAGFTEVGETLEETVQREVLEETGLRVKTSATTNPSPGPWPVTFWPAFSAKWTEAQTLSWTGRS